MACFWRACLRKLKKEDVAIVCGEKNPRDPLHFVRGMKKINETHPMDGVKWQGKLLTSKEKEELKEWIREYKESTIMHGKFTSILDPFFTLLCSRFSIDIRHQYLGALIQYSVDHPRYTLSFRSNRGHID